MALSVEDNVLRCFKKFGEKVTGQAARPRMKWHSTSLYKPATGVGGKLVNSRRGCTGRRPGAKRP